MFYRVKWEIDVDADSPEEAALVARDCQRPETTARVFIVSLKVFRGHKTPTKTMLFKFVKDVDVVEERVKRMVK